MWKNVKGQDRVKEILKKIYQSNKISHSYIFYGNEGIGKDAAAVEFAKLLNCDNPLEGAEACDVCKNCIGINSFRSPLFKFVVALPAGKNESDEDFNPLEKLEKEDFANYLNEIECKKIDKYYNISIPRANDIRISSIRQVKKEIYMTGKTGKKKVFIISKCDKMNQNSSNSLLKILEEPPKDSILILTTSKITSLLPTIIGRCQKIRFDNLDKKIIEEYLKESDSNITAIEAGFYGELSDGSITRCEEILNKNYLELRETVLNLLSAIVTGKHLKAGQEIDFVTGKKDKERIKQFLLLLIIWFRDLVFICDNSESLVINKDKIERLRKFEQNFFSDKYKIIKLIEESFKDVDSNIFPDLLLFNLSNNIRQLIKSKN